jgi:hypothetical protein
MSDDIPRSEIALDALKDVRAVLDHWAGSDWSHSRPAQEIDQIVHVVYARLRMAGMVRDRRSARWLAKIGSFSFPRFLPGDKTRKVPEGICFEVEITDGAKVARGRKVEVRMTPVEAARFAGRLTSMAGRYHGEPIPGENLEKLLPNGGEA